MWLKKPAKSSHVELNQKENGGGDQSTDLDFQENVETSLQPEPNSEESESREWKGVAQICFLVYSASNQLEMDHYLHGHFIKLPERKMFGLMGTRLSFFFSFSRFKQLIL